MFNTKNVPRELMAAPAAISADSVTLVWEKPEMYDRVQGYNVYQDGRLIAHTKPDKTHDTIRGLNACTPYTFEVEAVMEGEDRSEKSNSLQVKTKQAGAVIDVTKEPYCVDGTGTVNSTAKLQAAIHQCCPGDTVLIPEGAVVLSGALELKSDMTLQIDGTLKGSEDPADYIFTEEQRSSYSGKINKDGLILSRYEGWELYCYRSLINAGYLDPDNRRRMTCENIRICGTGSIIGGGTKLGTAMKSIYADKEKYPEYVSDGIGGRRARGRLLSFIQCRNVHITGINVENPPCWTIHMIYCDTVTTNGITIQSRGIDNGDGWDPDSSRNMMIFDTKFDTGDDCIAIKSGKNPDGNRVNIPTENIRIFDLKMLGGNGMAIGSEESGGVDGVYLRDCVIQNTRYGLELKAQRARGGYIRNIKMQDCRIDKFLAHSVSYNADGEAAPDLPVFEKIEIRNCTITGSGKVVELEGFLKQSFEDRQNYVKNVLMENVVIEDEAGEIHLKACDKIALRNVCGKNGSKPYCIMDQNTVSNITFI